MIRYHLLTLEDRGYLADSNISCPTLLSRAPGSFSSTFLGRGLGGSIIGTFGWPISGVC